MSFVFRVGPPSYVFPAPFAREVSETLERVFGFVSDNQYSKLETFIGKLSPPGLVRKPDDHIFCSQELPDGAWLEFQQSAKRLLKPAEITHLLALHENNTVCIAGVDEPETIRINRNASLQVAGLSALMRELLAYSSVAKLPVDPAELRRLQTNASPSVTNTYIELMLSVQFALKSGSALWLIR